MNEFLIGIDIGATSIRFIAYIIREDKFFQYKKIRFIRIGEPQAEVEENLCHAIDEILSKNISEGMELVGIGISTAALFYRDTGQIKTWPNNHVWDSFPLKDYLRKRYGVEIYLEDDSNCAALGEYWKGKGKGFKSFIYITISTGISCGIILNEALYIGTHGWAGEIGHIIVKKNGPNCTCGKKGCLQAIASGPGIQANYAINNKDAFNKYSLPQIAELARKGEDNAKQVFEAAGHHIAKMMGIMLMIFDIPNFILGGGVIKVGGVLTNMIEENINQCLVGMNRDINISYSDLQDINGLYGAVKLCL